MSSREELEKKFEEGDVFAGLELAELIEKSGDLAGARSRYEWMATNWETASAAIEAARLAYEMGDFDEIANLVGYANEAPDAIEEFWALLERHARAPELEIRMKAKAALQALAAQGFGPPMLILAQIANGEGRLAEARRLYEQALRDEYVGDHNAGYWEQLNEIWMCLGRYARAPEAVIRVKAKAALKTSADQGFGPPMLILARIANEQGRLAEARRLYEQALASGEMDDKRDPELDALVSGHQPDIDSNDDDEWSDSATSSNAVDVDIAAGDKNDLLASTAVNAVDIRIGTGDKDDLIALIESNGVVAFLSPEQEVALAKHPSVDIPRALAERARDLSPGAIRVLAKSKIFTARRNLAEFGGADLPPDVLAVLAKDDDGVVRSTVEVIRTLDKKSGQMVDAQSELAKIVEDGPVAPDGSKMSPEEAAAIVIDQYDRSKNGDPSLIDDYASATGKPIIDCHLQEWLDYADAVGAPYTERFVAALGEWWPEEFWIKQDQVIDAAFHQTVRDLARGGHVAALCEAGWIALVTDDDPTETQRLWNQAAKSGDGNAMFDLGFLAKQAGDDTAARAWYQMAAARGISDADDALIELDSERANWETPEKATQDRPKLNDDAGPEAL